MGNVSNQYRQEMEQRYLKFVQAEDSRDVKTQVVAKKSGDRKRRASPQQPQQSQLHDHPEWQSLRTQQQGVKQQASLTPMASTFGRYITSPYRVSTIIIDSTFRDTNLYPHANQFVVKLVDALRDVAAVRVMRTEFYQPSNSVGYFVMNEVRIPLQLYNIESAYVYMNGWQSTQVANDTSTSFFTRIGPGTEVYPAICGDIRQDPFLHTFLPAEPKLRRFHVKLLKADGSLYDVNNARVVFTLAVYSLAPGIPDA